MATSSSASAARPVDHAKAKATPQVSRVPPPAADPQLQARVKRRCDCCCCTLLLVAIVLLLLLLWMWSFYPAAQTDVTLTLTGVEVTGDTIATGAHGAYVGPLHLTFLLAVAPGTKLSRKLWAQYQQDLRAEVWYRDRQVADAALPLSPRAQSSGDGDAYRVPVTLPAPVAADPELAANLARGEVPVRAVFTARYLAPGAGYSIWKERVTRVCDVSVSPPWAESGAGVLAITCYNEKKSSEQDY